MANMSGSSFYTYCLKIFKRTDKSDEIYEAITDVIMELKLRFKAEDFKTVAYSSSIDTAGEYKLALPDDFGHLIGNVVCLKNTGDAVVLTKLSKAIFDSKYPYPDYSDVTTGVPKYYCIYGGEIFIAPVPDVTTYVFQFNYTTEEATAITSDTTSVPFTERYRWIIRCMVLASLYYGLGNKEEGQLWETRGEPRVALMIENEEKNTVAVTNVESNDFSL